MCVDVSANGAIGEWKIQVQIWNEMLLWAENVNGKNSINVYNLLQYVHCECHAFIRMFHTPVTQLKCAFCCVWQPESILKNVLYWRSTAAYTQTLTQKKKLCKQKKTKSVCFERNLLWCFFPFSSPYISSFVISCSRSSRITQFVYCTVHIGAS